MYTRSWSSLLLSAWSHEKNTFTLVVLILSICSASSWAQMLSWVLCWLGSSCISAGVPTVVRSTRLQPFSAETTNDVMLIVSFRWSGQPRKKAPSCCCGCPAPGGDNWRNWSRYWIFNLMCPESREPRYALELLGVIQVLLRILPAC